MAEKGTEPGQEGGVRPPHGAQQDGCRSFEPIAEKRGGRQALSSQYGWLRLNRAGNFASGTHAAGLFASGSLNVGGLNGSANPGTNNAVVAGSLGVGVFAPDDRLHVDGRIRAGALTLGPWPPNPSNYVFLGSNLLDQTNAGNYGLLFGTGGEAGATLAHLHRSRLIAPAQAAAVRTRPKRSPATKPPTAAWTR